MAVYKRSYATYAGGHTQSARRYLVLARYGWSEVFKSRVFTAFYCAIAFIPFLVGALFIYITDTPAVQALLQTGGLLEINRVWFLNWLMVEGWFSLLLCAWVGPTLVSPELSNGALPLFLSRPLSRTQYVIGKSLVLIVLISMISWVPALLLFAIQASLGPHGWAAANISVIPAMMAASLLWTAFLCALSLALSAWVRWRVVATGLTFAVFFLPAGFGTAMNLVLGTWWGNLLNFWWLMIIVWHHVFGLQQRLGYAPAGESRAVTPLPAAIIALCAATGLCLLALNKRLRAKEVVRG